MIPDSPADPPTTAARKSRTSRARKRLPRSVTVNLLNFVGSIGRSEGPGWLDKSALIWMERGAAARQPLSGSDAVIDDVSAGGETEAGADAKQGVEGGGGMRVGPLARDLDGFSAWLAAGGICHEALPW